MLALDQFVLWVNAESPYKTGKDYLDATRRRRTTLSDGGHGLEAGRPDHHGALEGRGPQDDLHPFKGRRCRGAVVGKHVDSTVNNPIEAIAHWRGGVLRPLCVLDDERMLQGEDHRDDVLERHPVVPRIGRSVDYVRGIFMPPGVSASRSTGTSTSSSGCAPDWKEFMEKGAFKDSFMTGKEYTDWVAKAEELHRTLMRDAGFLAK